MVDVARVTGYTDTFVHIRTVGGLSLDLPYLSTYRPQLDELVVFEGGVVLGPVTERLAPDPKWGA